MDVKPGYKQTEVGVIPEDWELRPLLTAVRVASGQVDPKLEPYRSMILIAPDHIEKATGRLLLLQTAAEQRAISGKYLFSAGDIVYSKIRPYLRKAILANFRGLCSADMYPLKPAADVSAGFMLATLLGHHFSKYAESVSVRSGMPKINRVELAEYSVALPPTVAEQEAIAEALSDADALIESLEQLIAKKRHVKQGAMQGLLSGKQRLPGFGARVASSKRTALGEFPGDWELVPLSHVSAFITKGSTPTTYGFQWRSSGVLFLRSECVSERGLDLSESMFIAPEAHQLLKRSEVRGDDILMTITGNVGRVVHLERDFPPANINQHIARIRILDNQIVTSYVFHFLTQRLVRKYYNQITTGQAYPQISLTQVRDTVLPMPSVSEQTAIAAILSDLDAEIAALEARLVKARQIKQGMMHNLLTGRIRLVGGDAAADT